MSHVNTMGMVLYLTLAIFGGFLTGLFSRYIYETAKRDFGRVGARLSVIVFYVAPVWAAFSLFKDDDLDVFYLLLIISFFVGVWYFEKLKPTDQHQHDVSYPPDADDD